MRYLLILSLLLMSSCSNENSLEIPKTTQPNESQNQSDDVVLVDSNSWVTTIEFNTLIHEFGKVKANQDHTYDFEIKNTGKLPLKIKHVGASCGCTVPKWSQNPILPGGTDKITVTFHPNEHQIGKTAKTIAVETNTDPAFTILEIRADVH